MLVQPIRAKGTTIALMLVAENRDTPIKVPIGWKVNTELNDNISADVMVASVSTDGTPNPYGWITDNRALSTSFGIPSISS